MNERLKEEFITAVRNIKAGNYEPKLEGRRLNFAGPVIPLRDNIRSVFNRQMIEPVGERPFQYTFIAGNEINFAGYVDLSNEALQIVRDMLDLHLQAPEELEDWESDPDGWKPEGYDKGWSP
jgi:hypothetical protein